MNATQPIARDLRFDAGLMRLLLGSGVLLMAALLVGMGFVMGFLPPQTPTLTSRQLAQLYYDHRTAIRIGCGILIVFWTLWITWGTAIAVLIRKSETRGIPVVTYTAIAGVGGNLAFFILVPVFWAVAAYRPLEIAPDITQTLHDIGWYCFLYTWPPLTLFCLTIAVSVFRDRNPRPVYPRWVGYLNLWAAFIISPACMIVFFKTGPFALDGYLAFHLPLGAFGGWMVAMTVASFRAVSGIENRESVFGS